MNDDDRSVWDYVGGCIVIYALFYIVGICIKFAILLICLLVKLIIQGFRAAYTKTKSWITSRKEAHGHTQK